MCLVRSRQYSVEGRHIVLAADECLAGLLQQNKFDFPTLDFFVVPHQIEVALHAQRRRGRRQPGPREQFHDPRHGVGAEEAEAVADAVRAAGIK